MKVVTCWRQGDWRKWGAILIFEEWRDDDKFWGRMWRLGCVFLKEGGAIALSKLLNGSSKMLPVTESNAGPN